MVTDSCPGWPRQLRFERLSVVGDPPESGRYEVTDTRSNEMLQVRVRGDGIFISDRLNPVLQWAVPVFVGRIERTGKQPTIDGLLRPSCFGLVIAAAPVVVPLLLIVAERYVTGAIMFGFLALFLWSQFFVYRRVAERTRVHIADFLKGLQP